MHLDAAFDVTATDDAVEFAFTVTNAGEEPVDLTFRSGAVADVAVFEEGTEVWRWSDDRMFTQALETETLAPGESLAHEATWSDPPPGTYTAEASLTARNVTVVEREPFEVP